MSKISTTANNTNELKNYSIIMVISANLIVIVLFLFISISPSIAYSINVEYFHMQGCYDCAITDPIIKQTERDYPNVTFEWVDTGTQSGLYRWEHYGFSEVPAIVINNETKISKENLTGENIKESINAYLDNKVDLSNNSLKNYWDLPLAFSMGIFSGFSPCLMAILGFILSYTAGTSVCLKDGMSRALAFGFGLVTAYMLLGICMLIFGKSLIGVSAISIIAGIISVLIGFNMLGIIKVPITLDNYVKRTTKKYVGSWTGLFVLGILFSLVKVPCSAPFLLVLINEALVIATIDSILLLLAFAVGVLTPFIIIGLVGGYALSERIRSYRNYIRTISGLVIIILGVWIML